MNQFDFRAMLLQGWPVLSVLMLMSIVSCTVILDRWLALRRRQMDAARFLTEICRRVREESVQAALRFCARYEQPAALVAIAVMEQKGNRESRERALAHALQAQIREMETYVPVLGTIASSAPFVGLLGTVIGIIKAFGDIARNVGGGPEVVASGIAEALITTAGGLLVAIPALMAYNYFVRRIQRMTEEIDLACFDLVETLESTRDSLL
jgi:biopolymer transport protein ExbB/TolQ